MLPAASCTRRAAQPQFPWDTLLVFASCSPAALAAFRSGRKIERVLEMLGHFQSDRRSRFMDCFTSSAHQLFRGTYPGTSERRTVLVHPEVVS